MFDTLFVTNEVANEGNFISVFSIIIEPWFWSSLIMVCLAMYWIRDFFSKKEEWIIPNSTTNQTVTVKTLPPRCLFKWTIEWEAIDKFLRVLLTGLMVFLERASRGQKTFLNGVIDYDGVLEVCFTFLMILVLYSFGGNSIIEWLINKALGFLAGTGIIKRDSSAITEEEFKKLAKP